MRGAANFGGVPAIHNSRPAAMTTDRTAALAILAGFALGLVTMALHPTGREVVAAARAGHGAGLNAVVHAMAIVGQGLALAGLLAFTRRFAGGHDVAVGAFVLYALASVAVLVAASASGFVAPGVLRGLAGADEATSAAAMQALRYTGVLNQAFATVYVLLAGCALLLWAAATLLDRTGGAAFAAAGACIGGALIAGIASGHLRLHIHGFGAVMLAQGAWFGWAALRMWRGAGG